MHDTTHDQAVNLKRRRHKNRPKKQITSITLQETDRLADRKVSENLFPSVTYSLHSQVKNEFKSIRFIL